MNLDNDFTPLILLIIFSSFVLIGLVLYGNKVLEEKPVYRIRSVEVTLIPEPAIREQLETYPIKEI